MFYVFKMRIEHHFHKVERFKATLSKLNYEDDYETMIEDFLLAAAHLINALLHQRKIVAEDKDIKHNHLFGFMKDEPTLGAFSAEIAELIQQLEQLRPSHVYGKGRNGDTARHAESIFTKLQQVCQKLMHHE